MTCTKEFTLVVGGASDCIMNNLVWGAPTYDWQLASGSAVGGFISCEANAPGGAPFEQNIRLEGSMTYTGAAKSYICHFDMSALGGDNASVSIDITSSVDGVLLSESLGPGDGPGTYDFPFTVPISAGATITVITNFSAGFIDFGPGSGSSIGTIDICVPNECVDWDAILWGAPTLFNGSFVPDSTTGAAFLGTTNGGVGFFQGEALFDYNGSGCDAQCDITVSGDVLPNDSQCKFTVAQVAPFSSLTCFGFAGSAIGTFNVPFSMPDTGGVSKQFRVTVTLTSILGSAVTNISGALSNV